MKKDYSKIIEIKIKIRKLKVKLTDTDYITDKLTAALAGYVVNGNKEKVLSIYNEYSELLAQRQSWRDEINELEKQLAEVQGC